MDLKEQFKEETTQDAYFLDQTLWNDYYIEWLEQKVENIDVNHNLLLKRAEQMKLENEFLINEARGHWDKEYKRAIGIGIDRIIKLIKRN